VLAGPKPNAEVLEAMSRVCRVLSISSAKSEDPDSAVRNSLAVLLPLKIPSVSAVTAEPMGQVEQRSLTIDSEIRKLIGTSLRGADTVQSELHKLLIRQLPTISKEGTE
jgi:hypothetical protein